MDLESQNIELTSLYWSQAIAGKIYTLEVSRLLPKDEGFIFNGQEVEAWNSTG